jgi:hypothetical protein
MVSHFCSYFVLGRAEKGAFGCRGIFADTPHPSLPLSPFIDAMKVSRRRAHPSQRCEFPLGQMFGLRICCLGVPDKAGAPWTYSPLAFTKAFALIGFAAGFKLHGSWD